MKTVEKGIESANRLRLMTEALFDLDEEQREVMEIVLREVTSPEQRDFTYAEYAAMVGLRPEGTRSQPMESENWTDEHDNPDGGWIEAPGLSIRWQRGIPDVHDDEPWNGCFLVTVLQAAKRQLEYYQSGKFKCEENKLALGKVNETISILNERQFDRFVGGVRGTHQEDSE